MNQVIILKLSNMNCAACAMDIDGELEDAVGVISANTNFSRQETKVVFDNDKVAVEQLARLISNKGYEVKEILTN